ncbi:hypothetical protein CPY51_05410 [Rhizobium tubonense]|uniref:Uncharacterized protein n=1 Tax=Rhizobium tubonense TaxID=484088 RepID=A0A2W4CTC7_9HYPH|nr:hypothetical protein CPY51_05410 [Rhizobium tubonense]
MRFEDNMHQHRLEKFYKDNPRGLSDSSRKNIEPLSAAVSAVEPKSDELDEKECSKGRAQTPVG